MKMLNQLLNTPPRLMWFELDGDDYMLIMPLNVVYQSCDCILPITCTMPGSFIFYFEVKRALSSSPFEVIGCY